MRLHHLEVTAFGPFADTVEVDFDALSEAGLFLLTGPTGAGKTSILDAVCFALYGDVPGDRNSAKRLRCDQAAVGVEPRVSLEATLSGRRFRIVRSPAWERPKKRGSGTTTQQASVSISERVDGRWEPLSNRLDETGHLITRLVGMTVTQFTQVALLPQGRFQAFLRARSDERHKLLQQLFRTGRFEHVERWLRDRRLGLRRDSQAAHEAVADLVSRISEAADRPLPEAWDIHDLQAPASSGELPVWADLVCDETRLAVVEAEATQSRAAGVEMEARTTLEVALDQVRQRARYDAAARERAALGADEAGVEAARHRLDTARRGAVVEPLHRLVSSTASTRDRRAVVAEDRAGRAADLLGLLHVDRDALAAAITAALDRAATVRATLPREVRLTGLESELAAGARWLTTSSEQFTQLAERFAGLPTRIAALRDDLRGAVTARSASEATAARLTDLHARLEAATLADTLDRGLIAARGELETAARARVELHERWLDLREARVEGMAAEIAGALVVGACCPVCGSADHPHLARPAEGAPDAAAEKAALKLLDDAKAVELAHDQRVRGLTTRLAVARDNAGTTPTAELRAQVAACQAELDELTAVAAREEALGLELEAAERQHATLGRDLHQAEIDMAAREASLERIRGEADQLRAEIDVLLDGSGFGTLPALLDDLLERARTCQGAHDALTDLEAAESGLAEAETALTAAATGAGFASAAEAVAAVLPAGDVESLSARISAHERRLAAVEEVLGEPRAAEVLAAPVPDVAALEAALAAARAALDRPAPGSRSSPPAWSASSGCAASSWEPSTPGPPCASRSSWPPRCPASSTASPPTTASRCDCPPTSSPSASPRSWPRPTCG